MISVRGIRLQWFALALGIVAIAAGIYLNFFRGRDYLDAQATIVSIEESEFSTAEDKDYAVTVRYTVEGKEYTQELGSYSPSYEVGRTVDILYDPADPARIVLKPGGFTYAILGIGVLLVALSLGSVLRGKKAQKALEQSRDAENGVRYAPSVPGPERELYFLTDLGTPKYGHRIEDRSRRVLYEAKMTKFTLTAPFGFDFIDHEHKLTTPHLVGHQESTEWDSWILDNHHTFTFDGEFIWKHLKRNGITVESSLSKKNPLFPVYEIFRDGRQIAHAEASSQYVHEEDAAQHGKLANNIPAMGFYRIRTTETNLDLLFVTLVAFARSEATDDKGGGRRAVLNTLKNN